LGPRPGFQGGFQPNWPKRFTKALGRPWGKKKAGWVLEFPFKVLPGNFSFNQIWDPKEFGWGPNLGLGLALARKVTF